MFSAYDLKIVSIILFYLCLLFILIECAVGYLAAALRFAITVV